ncbi:hypothetical protein VIBRN418_10398 [Vibrio sp. N418]|nr:hypothetical protein VIBRN418_10398 [Vibrio sp. N418]
MIGSPYQTGLAADKITATQMAAASVLASHCFGATCEAAIGK